MVGAILMTKHFSYILWGVGLWGVTIQTIGEQKLRLPFGQQLHVFFFRSHETSKRNPSGFGPPCGGDFGPSVFFFSTMPQSNINYEGIFKYAWVLPQIV